jgi:hypothetical protein
MPGIYFPNISGLQCKLQWFSGMLKLGFLRISLSAWNQE